MEKQSKFDGSDYSDIEWCNSATAVSFVVGRYL